MPPARHLIPLLFLAADLAVGAFALRAAQGLPMRGAPLAAWMLLLAGALYLSHNYRLEKTDAAEEFVHLLRATLLLCAVLLLAPHLSAAPARLSLRRVAALCLLLFAGWNVVRHLLRRLLALLPSLRTRTLIFGAGEMGRIFLDAARGNVYLNLQILGFIDDDAGKQNGTIDGVPVLGGSPDLEPLVARHRVERVVVAIPTLPRDTLVDFLFRFGELPARIEVIPDLYRVASTRYRLVGGIPLVSSDLALIDGANAAVKRAIDLLGAAAALLLFGPLLLLVALAVRLESSGPAIFSQLRLGLGGKPFRVLKFRSMFTDAEARLASLLAADPARRAEYEKYAKLSDDPRITRVGAFLRRTSLDEFPQFLNVLAGEMSLVGPRPYLLSEKEKMAEFGGTILLVKPGVTGLWQIRGRNDLTFRERVRLEAFYVRRWSLGLDLWILLSTLPVVLFRKGAR